VLTDLTFLEAGKMWWPEPEDDRLRNYERNRLLFEGKHEMVLKEFWDRIEREDEDARKAYAVVLNWFKRTTTLTADLLAGEPPDASAPEDGQQEALDRLLRENELWSKVYQATMDVDVCGTGVFKVRYDDGKGASIDVVPPEIFFVVVDEDDIRHTLYRVLAWTVGEHRDRRLKVEIHSRGEVEYRVYKLVDYQIRDLVEEPEVEATGIDEFLVQPVHGTLTSNQIYGQDGYQDLESIVGEMAARVAQMSKIMDKHSDPNMYGDEGALQQDMGTGEWEVKSSRFFPVSNGGTKPGYVTWDGQLDANFKLLEFLQEQLYILSETSASAFGQFKAGGAESGTALKLRMMPTLAKVGRIRMHMEPVIKRVLWVASLLEVAAGREGAAELDAVTLSWHDGLPEDEEEQTRIAAMQMDAGITSLDMVLRRLYGLEGEELEAEKERIAEQQAPPPAALPADIDFGEE